MRRLAHYLAIVLLIAFALPLPARAATGPPISNAEQRVNGHGFRFGADQYSPDISSNYIVWQDKRGTNASPEGNAIWSKNLSTRDESPVTTVSTQSASPRISGDWVVWSDLVGGNNDIFARQLPSGPVVRVTTDSAAQINPVIDGTLVVWEDYRNGTVDIFKKDLSGGSESAVVTASGNQTSPVVSGATVAWRDARRGTSFADVYIRDGANSEDEIKQVTGNAASFSPHRVAVAGTRLLWNEVDPACVGEMCDKPRILKTCVLPCTSPATVDSGGVITGPDLSGSRGVWLKETTERHAYSRDFATANPIQQVDTSDGGGQFWPNPRVEGTLAVWGQEGDLISIFTNELLKLDVFWRDLATGNPPIRAHSEGMGHFGVHLNPTADDDLVVYRAPGNPGFKVWATSLTGERRHREVSTVLGTDVSRPSIVGNRAVWSDARNCGLVCGEDVFEKDPFDSGTEVQLSGPPDSESRTPDVDGPTTVWNCGGNVCVDGTEIDITGNLLAPTSTVGNFMRVSGDTVIWHEFLFADPGPSSARVHALDIITEEDEILGAGLDVAGEFPDLDIDGSTAVWAGDDGKIYKNTPVGCGIDPSPCDHSASATVFEAPGVDRRLGSVSIGGTRVAWTDCDNSFGPCDIYTRTLAEADRHLVTNGSSAHADAPFVDSTTNRIYWVDHRNGEADIFMESVTGAALPQPDTTAPAPPTNFTATTQGSSVSLSWTNPTANDFYKVRILRRSGPQPPSGLDDTSASVIFEGNAQAFTDTDVVPGVGYTYAAFAFDLEPNFSSAVIASTAQFEQVIPEGATHSGFGTFVLLANPFSFPVTADISYLTPGGSISPGAVQNLVVDARERMTVSVNATLGIATDVATKVVTTAPIAVEGSVHKAGSLASMNMLASQPSPSWLLPEGVSHSGFTSFVTIANPNPATATHVDLDYMTGEGFVDGSDSLLIPAGGRTTVVLSAAIVSGGCGCADDVSTAITVAPGEPPVVAGVSIHKTSGDLGIGGSLGVTGTADSWVVAEGATHSGFHTFVLVANPDAVSTATVEIFYLTGSQGRVSGGFLEVPPRTRRTIDVNARMQTLGLQPDDVSTVIDRTAGPNVAVESSVQKQDGSGFVIADTVAASGTSSADASGDEWLAAEGATHSGFTTFILVANPDPLTAAVVDLKFLTPTGEVTGPQNQLIPAGTRKTFALNALAPGLDLSTSVTTDSGLVVVEMTIDRVVSGQGFSKGRSLAFAL